jgi:hypothetical protein
MLTATHQLLIRRNTQSHPCTGNAQKLLAVAELNGRLGIDIHISEVVDLNTACLDHCARGSPGFELDTFAMQVPMSRLGRCRDLWPDLRVAMGLSKRDSIQRRASTGRTGESDLRFDPRPRQPRFVDLNKKLADGNVLFVGVDTFLVAPTRILLTTTNDLLAAAPTLLTATPDLLTATPSVLPATPACLCQHQGCWRQLRMCWRQQNFVDANP